MINNINTFNNNDLTNMTNILCNELNTDNITNIEFNTLYNIDTSQTIQEQINNLGGADNNYNSRITTLENSKIIDENNISILQDDVSSLKNSRTTDENNISHCNLM